jgi:hypothetical protein
MNGWYRKTGSLVLFAVALQAIGGAAVWGAESKPQVASTQAASRDSFVFNHFERSIKQSASLSYALNYLTNHIAETSVSHATLMVLHLENAQKAYLPTLNEGIFKVSVQKSIDTAYRSKKSLTFTDLLAAIKDPVTRHWLMKARDVGFRISTAEGMYFPVLNYAVYLKFKPMIQGDIQSYVDLMVEETFSPPLNDAAIAIGWDELVRRTVQYENFLLVHKGSNRTVDIRRYYGNYVMSVFYGANNTPLFDSDPQTIRPKARIAYLAELKDKEDSRSALIAKLRNFMALVEQSDGKRTKEIDEFLKKNVPTDA